MNKKIIVLALILYFFASINVYAAGLSGWVKITNIQLTSSGDVFIKVDTPVNPDGCNSDAWVVLQSSHPNINRIYTALMAVYVAKLDIQYYVSGCTNYPIISYIETRN